jgi:hypothetical protein
VCEGNKPSPKLLPEKEPFGINLRQAVSHPEGPEGKLILGVSFEAGWLVIKS